MLVDKFNEFSDAQTVDTVAAHASTNVVDLGEAGDANVEVYFHTRVDTAFTSTGSATLTVALQTDSDPAFGTAATLYATAAIAKAALVAGYKPCVVRVPKGCKRYLRAVYTVAVAAMDTGKIDGWLSPDIDTNNFEA